MHSLTYMRDELSQQIVDIEHVAVVSRSENLAHDFRTLSPVTLVLLHSSAVDKMTFIDNMMVVYGFIVTSNTTMNVCKGYYLNLRKSAQLRTMYLLRHAMKPIKY